MTHIFKNENRRALHWVRRLVPTNLNYMKVHIGTSPQFYYQLPWRPQENALWYNSIIFKSLIFKLNIFMFVSKKMSNNDVMSQSSIVRIVQVLFFFDKKWNAFTCLFSLNRGIHWVYEQTFSNIAFFFSLLTNLCGMIISSVYKLVAMVTHTQGGCFQESGKVIVGEHCTFFPLGESPGQWSAESA